MEVIPPAVFSTGETHLDCWVQFWASQYKRDVDLENKLMTSHKYDQGFGVCEIQGKGEETGLIQPWED